VNKEEQDIIVFLEISATTKAKKTIISKEDVKCLLNLIDRQQKEFKDLELAYELYKDRYETLQKENEELKSENSSYADILNAEIKDYDTLKEEYDKLQKELDKKDETIDVMSEFLCGIDLVDELGQDSWNWNKKQMKEYFYKKVEEKYE
jgi:DNA gyrase/topoisomerase IV subunit A